MYLRTLELQGYGLWFWRRTFAGHDASFAWGAGGQYSLVFQDLNTVIAITSLSEVNAQGSIDTTNRIFALLDSELVPAID